MGLTNNQLIREEDIRLFSGGNMSEYRFVKFSDFEFVGNKFTEATYGLIEKTALHRDNRGGWKLYFYMPDGKHDYYHSVPKWLTKRPQQQGFIGEVKHLLRSGYLPRSAAKKVRETGFFIKDGTFDAFIERYFGDMAVKERQKSEESADSQRSMLLGIFNYFKSKGKFSICEITDEDINEWDGSLAYTKKRRGKGLISPSTRINWRKALRSALNAAKEHKYSLLCDPDLIEVKEFTKGGKVDDAAEARYVMFPMKLIDAILKCTYPDPVDSCEPNIKRIVQLVSEIGTRPGETYNLSDDNVFSGGVFQNKVVIKDLPNSPNLKKLEFSPKTKNSARTLDLSNAASKYLYELSDRLKGEVRYGPHKGELYEFPFLFVYRDKKTGFLVRDDSRLNSELQAVVTHAMNEFGLSFTAFGMSEDVKLEFYDLRRSCNYRLKIHMGYSDEEAANFLGHSVYTNKKNYTIPKHHPEINQVRASRSLMKAMKLIPKIAEEYSIHSDSVGV